MHELEIATFYLKKKSPQAALARAKRVLEGDFPDDIKTQARELMQKAEASLALADDKQNN
jgi:outer membrane protein assembly factor BamD (BamD/ComL family)